MATYGSFIYGTGILYGATLVVGSVSPATGPSTGGNPFVLTGSALALNTFDDDFLAAALDGTLWNDISSGGSITTGATHLMLSTSASSGSIAGIESVPIVNNFQIETNVNIPRITAYPPSVVSFYTMCFYVDANNYASISVNVGTTSSDITLECKVVIGGSTIASYETDWTTGISTFRILRWNSKVYFIANGEVVFTTTCFNATNATYRIFAYNNAANYDVSGVVVNSYRSIPYVVFDDTPVLDTITVSGYRARGTVPPSIDEFHNEAGYAGLVTVYYVSSATGSLADAYEYYFEKNLVLVDNQQDDLVLSIVDDPIVRTPGDVRRGL